MSDRQGVFVTGGTGALGSAVTGAFLAAGHAVAVTYRTEREWSALAAAQAEAFGEGRLLGLEADVTDEASVASAVAAAAQRLGAVSILVHAAGGFAGGEPVERVAPKTVRSMIDLNLISAFWAARAMAPHARRSGRGRLLFVSSRGALDCHAGAAAYAAAKLGLHALVQTMAKELKRDGTTVNAVLPSVIDTPANRRNIPDGSFEDWVKPEAIADLLLFLASDGAAATSGALIPIYGRA